MLYVSVVSCMFGFIFSGNANFVTGLCHARRFCDRFFAFNCCKEGQYNLVKFSERTSFGSVTFHCVRYKQSASVLYETYFTLLFFAKSALQNSVPSHVRFTTFTSVAIVA